MCRTQRVSLGSLIEALVRATYRTFTPCGYTHWRKCFPIPSRHELLTVSQGGTGTPDLPAAIFNCLYKFLPMMPCCCAQSYVGDHSCWGLTGETAMSYLEDSTTPFLCLIFLLPLSAMLPEPWGAGVIGCPISGRSFSSRLLWALWAVVSLGSYHHPLREELLRPKLIAVLSYGPKHASSEGRWRV